tara:strand:+ start:232 stop:678 length:447 start_codon:yes stop_codon:yes gene_type:complete
MNDRMKKFYMTVAQECANMSRAVRLQVGAVIVKNDNIISFSWNGMPHGWDNNCEDSVMWKDGKQLAEPLLVSKPEVLHAEMNSLMKLAKSNESGDGAAIFITHAPCIDCAKGIYQAGIKEVYYKNDYRSSQGIEFLEKCGIQVEQMVV